MKDRLLRVLQEESMTSNKFAELMEVRPSTISHLLSGRNYPNFEFIGKMLVRLPNINPDWLINGTGSMFRDSTKDLFGFERVDDSSQMPDKSSFVTNVTTNKSDPERDTENILDSNLDINAVESLNSQIPAFSNPVPLEDFDDVFNETSVDFRSLDNSSANQAVKSENNSVQTDLDVTNDFDQSHLSVSVNNLGAKSLFENTIKAMEHSPILPNSVAHNDVSSQKSVQETEDIVTFDVSNDFEETDQNVSQQAPMQTREQKKDVINKEISDQHTSVKTVTESAVSKVIIFYNDNTFEIYNPK